ncbi:PTAB protein [Verticillium dahliae]|nr:UPF0202 protein KRE33 [Verticillium dahliae VDG2]KAH6704943.1 PTAB protein [Verticillium dahliae]
MTSMGPSFAGHPAGMHQHPGVPGHPMAPGMPHNPSQQGAPGGGMPQQMHMAVSGPGGQVNPAAMMGGMPPGAGAPNAHALQHLNPAQAQMFQQGQFGNFGSNPSMAQLQQHQRFIQQQQAARQHAMAQQAAFQSNMQVGVNGMPMGVHMNPAQMAAFRQARMQPHAHNQAMLAHQIALQQQQQVAQNQQMQQGGQPGQPVQMSAQQMQSLQQAQMAALQAQQQGQQQAQQQQQQQQQAQQQQAQQQQAQQQAQQAQQQQQQQQAQQQQQQGQPPQQPQQPGGPQPQQQTPQQQAAQPAGPQSAGHPTPSQTPGPQPNQQPQPPQAQNQAQGPQPGQQPQQQLNPAQQQAQHAAAQAAMANNMALAQQQAQAQQARREAMKGHCLLKLMQFSEHLSGFPGSRGKDDLSYWNMFVNQFFSTKGVFRHSVHITDHEDPSDKQYEISYPALARYFHTHFDSGVKNMQLIMEKGTTDRPLPGDGHWIENTKSSLVYWFDNGSHLVATGTVRAHFDHEQKIELFEFVTSGHEEYISRKSVIESAKPAHNWVKEWHKVNSQDSKTSPEMSKKGKARPLKSPQNPPPEALVDLPESSVKRGMGVTEEVFQFLEIVEVFGQMNPLFGFSHSHPGMRPYLALEQYVNQINSQPQPNMNGQPMQQGPPRTPGFGQFPVPQMPPGGVGASPAQPHMQLPGSPHIMGSPAQVQMQAPGMQLQQSQQGTSSSGPSANTSPASNKRRRPSGVKTEDDGSSAPTPQSGPGGQVNGVGNKGKPPTPRMPKRVKGNPA